LATLEGDPQGGLIDTVNLSTAQTGTGATTNVLDRGAAKGSVLLKITTTVGATPTCTFLIEGSADGTNFFQAAYADHTTPATVVATTFVVTTATTGYKIVQANQPFRYLRVTLSANTNVTSSIDVWTTA
jgi:hypothetical protein